MNIYALRQSDNGSAAHYTGQYVLTKREADWWVIQNTSESIHRSYEVLSKMDAPYKTWPDIDLSAEHV